jgi:hypothetical protein
MTLQPSRYVCDDNRNRRDSGVSRGDGCERKNGAQRSFFVNVIARSDDNRNRCDSGENRCDGCERKNGAQRSFFVNVIARSDDRATTDWKIIDIGAAALRRREAYLLSFIYSLFTNREGRRCGRLRSSPFAALRSDSHPSPLLTPYRRPCGRFAWSSISVVVARAITITSKLKSITVYRFQLPSVVLNFVVSTNSPNLPYVLPKT